MGAGELLPLPVKAAYSTSPELLFSLWAALALLLASLLLLPVSSPFFASELTTSSANLGFGGALQVGTCHTIPVKLLRLKLLRSHFRQGFPVRSRARRPALIAPWFAFGPSLWVAVGPDVRAVLSIVPSSLIEFH